MKITRSYDDFTLKNPLLIEPEVYFADDGHRKYKVMISSVGKHKRLLSIGKCSYDGKPVDDTISDMVKKSLNLSQGKEISLGRDSVRKWVI